MDKTWRKTNEIFWLGNGGVNWYTKIMSMIGCIGLYIGGEMVDQITTHDIELLRADKGYVESTRIAIYSDKVLYSFKLIIDGAEEKEREREEDEYM